MIPNKSAFTRVFNALWVECGFRRKIMLHEEAPDRHYG